MSKDKSTDNDARVKALDALMGQVNKQFGQGTIMSLGEDNIVKTPVTPTGSLKLDIALGTGGLPKGRIIEIYGPESSGKTLLSLEQIKSVQAEGGVAAFIDAEHALDPTWAKKVGVDLDSLLISQPDNGEQGMEILDMIVRSGAVDLVVVDSVAAMVPKKEIDGEMGDSHVGLQARLMSQALRKITGPAAATGTQIIFINQLREKIGVFFGSPETTTGGKALKFYASVRIDVRRIATIKDGTESVGSTTRAKIVKNKLAAPFAQAEFDIIYKTKDDAEKPDGWWGISRNSEIRDLAVELGLLKKSGAWYQTPDGSPVGQGGIKTREYLDDNPDIAAELEKKIRDHYFPEGIPTEFIESEDDMAELAAVEAEAE